MPEKGEIVKAKAVKRDPGYLYYIDKEGNICRVKMKKRTAKKKEE